MYETGPKSTLASAAPFSDESCRTEAILVRCMVSMPMPTRAAREDAIVEEKKSRSMKWLCCPICGNNGKSSSSTTYLIHSYTELAIHLPSLLD